MNNLQNIISLVKKCLGIVDTATIKDDEITLLINTAISDMTRLGIAEDFDNPMYQSAIVQYCKGNFGMIRESTKELCMRSYNILVSSMQCNVEDETED